MQVFHDEDISLAPLREKRLAILGFGNHGRPQAFNLRDSGIEVKIGLRKESCHREQASSEGFDVLTVEEASQWADVLMLILPDDQMTAIYQQSIEPFLSPGNAIGFCHGLAIHAGWLKPKPEINVFLSAPKSHGLGIRQNYLSGSGVPAFYSVHQDPSGDTEQIALAYAKGVGCGRVGILKTTFEEETVCDVFSEQAVLCGGLSNLIKTAFETLVEQGYSQEVSYFRCLYEIKLLANLIQERGIIGMREAVSTTALFGDLTRGEQVIDGHVKENMRRVLKEITSGKFMDEMKAEFAAGRPTIREQMARDYHHPIEETHRVLSKAFRR